MRRAASCALMLLGACAPTPEPAPDALLRDIVHIDWESRAKDDPMIGDEAWRVRMLVRHDLVRRGAAVVPELLRRLEGAGPWVRAFILETLAWIGDERALPAAERWSRRGEPRCVRSAAIRVLGALKARDRLNGILAEPLEPISPYEVGTDWIREQAKYALESSPARPTWDPSAWNSAVVGRRAPAAGPDVRIGGRPLVLLFVLADW